MKLARLLLPILFLAADGVVVPQGLEASTTATNSTPVRGTTLVSPPLTEGAALTQPDIVAGKKLQVSGPLVRPFKGKKIWNAPRGLLHLINPFARAEPRQKIERVGGLSSRPWTSTVGWSPGASAFPDAKTHEPTLNLISVSRTVQR